MTISQHFLELIKPKDDIKSQIEDINLATDIAHISSAQDLESLSSGSKNLLLNRFKYQM